MNVVNAFSDLKFGRNVFNIFEVKSQTLSSYFKGEAGEKGAKVRYWLLL